jgi:glucose-1-phosphate thymidylyltransferase
VYGPPSRIREFLLISSPDDAPAYQRFFGNGARFGVEISYTEQPAARGIADALVVGKQFGAVEAIALVLS